MTPFRQKPYSGWYTWLLSQDTESWSHSPLHSPVFHPCHCSERNHAEVDRSILSPDTESWSHSPLHSPVFHPCHCSERNHAAIDRSILSPDTESSVLMSASLTCCYSSGSSKRNYAAPDSRPSLNTVLTLPFMNLFSIHAAVQWEIEPHLVDLPVPFLKI